jgi:hypothetical protein
MLQAAVLDCVPFDPLLHLMSRGAPVIREIQGGGIRSLRGVARALAARGVPTARGGPWTAVQVSDILRRVG